MEKFWFCFLSLRSHRSTLWRLDLWFLLPSLKSRVFRQNGKALTWHSPESSLETKNHFCPRFQIAIKNREILFHEKLPATRWWNMCGNLCFALSPGRMSICFSRLARLGPAALLSEMKERKKIKFMLLTLPGEFNWFNVSAAGSTSMKSASAYDFPISIVIVALVAPRLWRRRQYFLIFHLILR